MGVLMMNNPASHRGGSRREFLLGTTRYAVVSLLAGLTAVGLRRGWRSDQSLTCINQGICGSCVAFEKCDLPQALSVKATPKPG
jgi:hypothetical protein